MHLQRRGRRGRFQRLPTNGVSREGCRVGIGEAALLRTAMKMGLWMQSLRGLGTEADLGLSLGKKLYGRWVQRAVCAPPGSIDATWTPIPSDGRCLTRLCPSHRLRIGRRLSSISTRSVLPLATLKSTARPVSVVAGEEHGGEVANDDRMARRGASAAALAAVVTHTDEKGDESGGGGGACADARLSIASQEAGRVLAEELVSTHP